MSECMNYLTALHTKPSLYFLAKLLGIGFHFCKETPLLCSCLHQHADLDSPEMCISVTLCFCIRCSQ